MSIVVKVCGLSTPESVDVAVQAGAHNLSVSISFSPSPRAIQPSAARDLAQRVPNAVRKVAVVVDPTNDTLGTIVEALGTSDIVQLHGNEPPERVNGGSRPLWLSRNQGGSRSQWPDDVAHAPIRFGEVADMLLFDAKAQSWRHASGRQRTSVRLVTLVRCCGHATMVPCRRTQRGEPCGSGCDFGRQICRRFFGCRVRARMV